MQMNRVESRAAIYLPRRDPKQRDSGASAKGQPKVPALVVVSVVDAVVLVVVVVVEIVDV